MKNYYKLKKHLENIINLLSKFINILHQFLQFQMYLQLL